MLPFAINDLFLLSQPHSYVVVFLKTYFIKKNHNRFLFIYIYIYIYIYILNKKIIYKIKKNIEFDDVHDLHQEFS